MIKLNKLTIAAIDVVLNLPEIPIARIKPKCGCDTRSPQASDIANHFGLKPRYLEKVLQKLTKAGILFTLRGFDGGFLLNKLTKDITIYEIIVAVNSDKVQMLGTTSKKLNWNFRKQNLMVSSELQTMTIAQLRHDMGLTT